MHAYSESIQRFKKVVKTKNYVIDHKQGSVLLAYATFVKHTEYENTGSDHQAAIELMFIQILSICNIPNM